jgi:spore coat polysaccharide biosynthesis protein SpsF
MPVDERGRRRAVVAIIQARFASTRLRGKALIDICGKPMLQHVVERTMRSRGVDEIWVATTVEPEDDEIAALCESRGWPVYRGSQADVLDRYLKTARQAGARIVVRITSDCPLIDPELIDEVLAALRDKGADYASNALHPRSYPRGLDAEAMTMEALERAAAEATEPFEREHVTPYLYLGRCPFRLATVRHDRDLSAHRWTVDTAEDLALVREILRHFGGDNAAFGWREVLASFDEHPSWYSINADVKQKGMTD